MKKIDSNGLFLMNYQGKLFEESMVYLSCSSKIFIRRFLHSNLLKTLDKNNSGLISLDVKEGLDSLNEEFGESNYGKIKYNSNALYWIGYLYRYISYTREVSTRFAMKTFPIDMLLKAYEGYHTQDMEWVISSLLEAKKLNKNYFDKNWRLMTMLRNKINNFEYDNNVLISLIKKYIKNNITIKEATSTLGCSKKEFIKKVNSYKFQNYK